jgi:hypothetical protein
MTILLIAYDWHGINPLFCVLSMNNYKLYQFDDLPVGNPGRLYHPGKHRMGEYFG